MRGYTIIESDIYSKLDWNLDLIVKCLEVIRVQMPHIVSAGAVGIEFDLIAVGNPQGPPYPAIGMHCPVETDLNTVLDLPQIDDKVNQWVRQTGLNELVEKASAIQYIDWERLRSMKTFPGARYAGDCSVSKHIR